MSVAFLAYFLSTQATKNATVRDDALRAAAEKRDDDLRKAAVDRDNQLRADARDYEERMGKSAFSKAEQVRAQEAAAERLAIRMQKRIEFWDKFGGELARVIDYIAGRSAMGGEDLPGSPTGGELRQRLVAVRAGFEPYAPYFSTEFSTNFMSLYRSALLSLSDGGPEIDHVELRDRWRRLQEQTTREFGLEPGSFRAATPDPK